MEDFWSQEEILKLANPMKPGGWEHPYPEAVSPHETCENCGGKIANPDIGRSDGLCRDCHNENPNLCEYCSEPAAKDAKFCMNHTIPCEKCEHPIEDLGEYDGNTFIGDDVSFCEKHRNRCRIQYCDEPIMDQKENPSSELCENHRKNCRECKEEINDLDTEDAYGAYVPEDVDYCKKHRNRCTNCNDIINDQHDYPKASYCEDCRKSCGVCGQDVVDDSDSSYCKKHRRFCEDCDDEIEDIEDHPDSNFCEYHRYFCEGCGDEIEDEKRHESEYCLKCRKHCKNVAGCSNEVEDRSNNFCDECSKRCLDCDDEIEDIGHDSYRDALKKEDKYGDSLSDYCQEHRNRCRICNGNIYDYDKKLKEHEETKNPEKDWHNLCSKCENYIKSDWL